VFFIAELVQYGILSAGTVSYGPSTTPRPDRESRLDENRERREAFYRAGGGCTVDCAAPSFAFWRSYLTRDAVSPSPDVRQWSEA